MRPEFTGRGRSACVCAYWITGHSPPQIHEVRLQLPVFRSVTSKGRRLSSPPTRNHKGSDISAQVAAVLERLATA